jgi:hypothetical protein
MTAGSLLVQGAGFASAKDQSHQVVGDRLP